MIQETFRRETFINADTGEIITGREIELQLLREQQQAVSNKIKGLQKKKEKSEFGEFVGETLGGFNFSHYIELMNLMRTPNGKFDGALAFRFIYLSTYMDFDNNLRFGISFRGKYTGYMREKDLGEVMGLSRNHVTKFKQNLIKLEILSIDSETGIMHINTRYCHKGKLKNSLKGESVRVFENGIQTTYKNSLPKEHKKLGMFIQLLPYLNIQHNVLCFNVEEEQPKEIKPLSIQDICRIVGYQVKNARRLERELITITVGEEPALMLHWHNLAYVYSINPKIFYRGNDMKSLRALINLFNMRG